MKLKKNTPRKHGLKATLYQDFGWPAKELK